MDSQQITSIIIAALISGTITIGVVAQAWAARRRPRRPDAVEQRLERMEQAIDTIAVEVERVAEGHRFTAKLLAERLDAPPAPRVPERVITPH